MRRLEGNHSVELLKLYTDPSYSNFTLTHSSILRVLTPLDGERKGMQVLLSQQASAVTEQSLLTELCVLTKNLGGKYCEILSISRWFQVHWPSFQKTFQKTAPAPLPPSITVFCKEKNHNIGIPPPRILLSILLFSFLERKGICSIAHTSKCNLFFMRFCAIPW